MRCENFKSQLKVLLFLTFFCWFCFLADAKASVPAFFSYEELSALYEQDAGNA
jgi:hypothetical protein